MVGMEQPDRRFCTFTDAKYGFRAMCRIYATYARKHDIRTVREIIARWAPASENDVEAYVRSVCEHSGFSPDMVIGPGQWARLAKAMAHHECGGDWWSDSVIEAGVRMAVET